MSSQAIRRKSDQHPAVRSFHRTLDEVKQQKPVLASLNHRLDQRLEHLRAETASVDPRREEDGETVDVEIIELADEPEAPTRPDRPRPA